MAATHTGAAAGKLAAALLLALLAASCSDFGAPLQDSDAMDPDPDPNPLGVVFDELVPARTVEGDSVRVLGSGFGEPAGAALLFAGSGMRAAAEAEVLSWSDTEVIVLVPPGAASGPITLERDGATAAGPSFDVAPRRITYSGDLVPLFDRYGCTSCHGGSGNLYVRPWASLLMGNSNHGPVVVPRRSAQSLIVQRIGPGAMGVSRMPQGGPYLIDAEIRVFADWIDQGARND